MLYLDNAATTPTHPRVIRSMCKVMEEEWGNPSSLHMVGQNANHTLEVSRAQIASYIGAESKQIIFTSGGSEANNLAIIGMEERLRQTGRRHIIVSAIEHPSVLNVVREMERRGFEVSIVAPTKNGSIRVDDINFHLKTYTGMVCLMYVNNETGMIMPVKEVAELCNSRGIFLHCDAVQALSCMKLDCTSLGVDSLSLSAHKIGGPRGVGCLFVRDRALLNPIIFGGGQENGLRSGTENVCGIAGFAEATKLEPYKNIDAVVASKENLFHKLQEALRDSGFCLSMNGKISSPTKVMNIAIFHDEPTRNNGVDAEAVALALAAKGICVSTGSACSSHSETASHVLRAMGMSEKRARSSLRLSFSSHLENWEITCITKAFQEVVETL